MEKPQEITDVNKEVENLNDSTGEDSQQKQQDDNVDYKALYKKVKQESITRREKLKRADFDRYELETKLKEQEDYKSLYESTLQEVEELKEYKTKTEQRQQTKRENLLNEIKSISETQREKSFVEIADSIQDNDKLELYLKSISQVNRKTLPVDNRKIPMVKPSLYENVDSKDINAMQRLYREDNLKYREYKQNRH